MSSTTAAPLRPTARAFRRIPALDVLRGYTVADAKADVLAGISVAAVAVPQAMAYAMIAGLPAQYGLYTAIVMTGVGAVFASSRQLVNGPTNAISIALLSAVGSLSPDERVQAAVLLSFMMGAIQLAICFARLGDLTRYISHSVIIGFTAGASLLLALDQMKNLFGLEQMGNAHDHFLVRFWLSMTHGGSVHPLTLEIGLASIAMVLAMRWAKRRLDWPLFPEFLVVVVVMAAATAHWGWDRQGVKVVGDIPAHLPSFQLPVLDAVRMRDLAGSSLALALLGLLEAISMAKVIAASTKQKLDLNQQILSEGVANIAGSCFQSMPGAGSLTRSAINQQAGAQTQWSGIASAVAVAFIMVTFAPYARFIPRSALAGLLILTAARMVDFKDLRFHWRTSRFDAAIVATTAIAAFAVSIEFCVLIGVFMSFMLVVPRTGQIHLTEFFVTPEGQILERLADDEVCGCLRIFGLEGEMYFGAGASLENRLDAIEEGLGPESQVVVLRMKRMRSPDAVGVSLLDHFIDRLTQRGLAVVLCGVRHGMYVCLEKSGLVDKIGKDNLFLEQPVRQTSTMLAIEHAQTLVEYPCAICRARREAGKNLYYQI